MEDLSKQQLILVALLISFVTSLATGIVTVSLMDQAPNGMTRTITQVIQQTVADALPASGATSTASVSIAVNDQVADAVAAVTPSIVRLRDPAGSVIGMGLVVSPSGAVMTDKNILSGSEIPQAVFSDGTIVPMVVTRFQIQGDIAFMTPSKPLAKSAKPISFGSPTRLGVSVWSLSGTSTYMLSQGIVTELDPIASSTSSIIRTSLRGINGISGLPLFDATGAVIGISTQSLANNSDNDFSSAFYPVEVVRDAVPR